MYGIESIASYLPFQIESNLDLKEKLSLDVEFLEKKVGVINRRRMAEDEETSDLCCRAFDSLIEKKSINPEEIDFLMVCTQNPDARGLPHTSAIVHQKLGLGDQVAAFDISLGCSGYVYGLSVALSFMKSNDLRKGLFFTADPYSKIVKPDDRNTVLLFGDAATVTLLGKNGIWNLQDCIFSTRGSGASALWCHEDGLFMNGRAIFNFALLSVPAQVKELLEKAGLEPEDIDLFLFHQGSRFMVEQIIRRLGIPEEKAPIDLREKGNTVSSSIPLLLEDFYQRTDIERILLSGFGVGLSWASCILRQIDGKERA